MSIKVGKDESEQKAINDIREHGLHIIHVHEDSQGPGFTYSIGLFENYAHPEVIIIGLKLDLARVLLNNIAFDVKEGIPLAAGEFHDNVLDDFPCYFGEVPRAKYAEYVGWARWFYEGDNFPLLQCVHPTIFGKFPWEKDFPDEARWPSQMLIDPPREH